SALCLEKTGECFLRFGAWAQDPRVERGTIPHPMTQSKGNRAAVRRSAAAASARKHRDLAPRQGSRRPLLYGCFFASGAAGLILEIVWSKYLSLLLGNSIYGVSTVVAAFLGGLGIGAAIGGRLAARSRTPLAAYGRLEALVGILGISSPLAILVAPPLFAGLYEIVGGYGPIFFSVRFALLFLVLLLPTTAMGATLPLLVEHFDRSPGPVDRKSEGRSGGAVARLYALNTAGAVTGVVLAGFVLIPASGLAASATVAAAIDFAVAGSGLLSRPR